MWAVACPLDLIRERYTVTAGKLKFTWNGRQNSVLESGNIAEDRDTGNLAVERPRGVKRADAVYDLMLSLVFRAFVADGKVNKI